MRSISLPSISTGAFGYPMRLAAPGALKTIIAFLDKEQRSLEEVRMVFHNREQDTAHVLFAEELQHILSERASDGVRMLPHFGGARIRRQAYRNFSAYRS